jgi:gliding motility-associated-like protein
MKNRQNRLILVFGKGSMINILGIVMLFVLSMKVSGQNVSIYTFAQTSGTYSAISGGTTILASANDDTESSLTNIGFTFIYHGVAYTQFAASPNGYIALGSVPFATGTPLNFEKNAIAFCARDGKTNSDVTYQLSGTSPNQVLTIQYPNWYLYYSGTTETLNAQIKLYETSNIVQIVYGSSSHTTSYTSQAGLTGNVVTDFNVRTTTANWASTTAGATNSATMTWSSTVFPADGQTYTWTPPDPCYGTPTPGNTVSTPATVCPDVSFTLSLSNTLNYSGMTYQWQSSTDGITWVDIAGATSANYSTTQTVATYYRCFLNCTSSGLTDYSTSLNILMNTPTSCYCTSSATSTSDMDISNITFGTINNTSATVSLTGTQGMAVGTAGMYSDWRSSTVPVASVQQGATVSFSVTIDGDDYSHRVDVYFDFNHDGDLTDANESYSVFAYADPTLPNTTTVNITIPLSATTGNTLMRVVCVESSSTSPCGTYTWGETEDYYVNITLAPPCAGMPTGGTVTSVPTADCSGGVLSITGSTVASGFVYQWQSSPTGAAPWTDIVSATGDTYTTPAFGFYYRRVVLCTSSGLSDNSSSILLTSSAPTNDECANAVLLSVNPTSTCTSFVSGTVSCASASSQTNSCSGTADDDVWYQFVATDTTHTVSLSNVAGSTTDMSFSVFSGSCTSPTNILCSDNNSAQVHGLVIGDTYYIRVFTYTSTTGQTSTFDLCVSSIVLEPNAFCTGSDPFCTGTTYNFPANVNAGVGQSGPDYGCLCTQPNPVWYYLRIANPGSLSINIASSCGDVDYAAWGPFPALTCDTADLTSTVSSCGGNLSAPAGNMVDCAYSTSATETLDIPNALAGQYYLVMITNYANCSGNIIFNQVGGTGGTDCSILTPPVNNNGPLCAGQTLLLTADSVAGATYSWTGPSGFALTTTDHSISITNVTVANAGIYSLLVYDAHDTSNVATSTVVVYENPIATITNNSGTDILTCNTTSINATAGVGDAYVWSGGATTTTVTNTFTSPGTYVVTVTNGGLCASTDSIIITQDTLWPVAIINNPGGATELTCVIASISVVAGTGDTYAWSGGSTPTTAANSFTLPGIYMVTISTSNGCTATTSITITQQAQVTLSLLSMVPDHCAQGIGEATVTATGGSGAYTFTWDGTEIPQESNGIDHASNLFAGTYLVEVSDGPCVNNITVTVNNIPGPIASFEPFPTKVFSSNPEFRFLNKSTNGYNQTINGYAYFWSFGDGAFSTIESPTHLYNGEVANFIVFMEVTDNFGCKDSISQVVSIIEDLKVFVPNSFTPDGDGLNDVFKPSGVGYQEKGYEMIIFDRWGKQVFISNQFDKGWDGIIEGEKMITSAVFTYRIVIYNLIGMKSVYNGHVTMLGGKSGN